MFNFVQELQGLEAPHEMMDLTDIYEFCGHRVGNLGHLEGKLKAFEEEKGTDCKALRMVLAAAKKLHSGQVRGSGGGGRCSTAACRQRQRPTANGRGSCRLLL
jgi:hypothetical protein